MGMRVLDPDQDDKLLVMYGTLKRCPFCRGLPVTITSVNDETMVYRGIVSCSKCQGQSSFNGHSRYEARKGAIERWESRAEAAPSPAHPEGRGDRE